MTAPSLTTDDESSPFSYEISSYSGTTLLGDDGLYLLARSPRLANLRTLQVTGTRVGDAAVHAVMESPHLRRLKWFRVGEGISPATRRLMESRFPGL